MTGDSRAGGRMAAPAPRIAVSWVTVDRAERSNIPADTATSGEIHFYLEGRTSQLLDRSVARGGDIQSDRHGKPPHRQLRGSAVHDWYQPVPLLFDSARAQPKEPFKERPELLDHTLLLLAVAAVDGEA